jgi:dienelactone hydrolase
MPNITTEKHTLAVAGGSSMQAFVARPEEKGSFPGMLVFQEAFGVNAHIRDVAQRIAREGYVAIAPELFHRSAAPGLEVRYDDFPSAMPHMKALTEQGLADDVRAAYEWLRDSSYVTPDRVGSIGFCMGGRVSFLANATIELRAAIFVLRRRYRACTTSTRGKSSCTDALLLGRTRQTHPAGPNPLRNRCGESRRQALHQRRHFRRRPRILLRCSPFLQSGRGERSMEPGD